MGIVSIGGPDDEELEPYKSPVAGWMSVTRDMPYSIDFSSGLKMGTVYFGNGRFSVILRVDEGPDIELCVEPVSERVLNVGIREKRPDKPNPIIASLRGERVEKDYEDLEFTTFELPA